MSVKSHSRQLDAPTLTDGKSCARVIGAYNNVACTSKCATFPYREKDVQNSNMSTCVGGCQGQRSRVQQWTSEKGTDRFQRQNNASGTHVISSISSSDVECYNGRNSDEAFRRLIQITIATARIEPRGAVKSSPCKHIRSGEKNKQQKRQI